ncbi:ABC transporter substrate-binding protein [Massilia sp. TS11]|uniref:substrate-binding periplasmic protein n=1 Tax=Massilia sp. TS11 TaxID=2908003 RepID=UPI001EDAD5C8|nr:transporter substrate-binding domain-containing protein [Massilia sp. TS11]MCG2584497.1 transporter substrate-binding domain-containing protein [Massilia sp. TS11]
MLVRRWIGLAACLIALHAQGGPRVFQVGVENLQYAPLHSTSATGDYTGYARDVLDAFAQEYGYTFRYVPLPVERLFRDFLRADALDFKYPDNPAWQTGLKKGLHLTYSLPIVPSYEGLMVLPANKGKPLARLHSVGTVRGFTPVPYQQAIQRRSLSLQTDTSFAPLLQRVLAGQLDAVYINADVGHYLLTHELGQPNALVFDTALPHLASDFSLSTRRHHEIVAQFNNFLQKQRPLLQRLRAKYTIGDPANP